MKDRTSLVNTLQYVPGLCVGLLSVPGCIAYVLPDTFHVDPTPINPVWFFPGTHMSESGGYWEHSKLGGHEKPKVFIRCSQPCLAVSQRLRQGSKAWRKRKYHVISTSQHMTYHFIQIIIIIKARCQLHVVIVNNSQPRYLQEYAPPCASFKLIRLCKLTLPVSYSYL